MEGGKTPPATKSILKLTAKKNDRFSVFPKQVLESYFGKLRELLNSSFFFFLNFLDGYFCPCNKKVKKSNRQNIYVRKNLAN